VLSNNEHSPLVQADDRQTIGYMDLWRDGPFWYLNLVDICKSSLRSGGNRSSGLVTSEQGMLLQLPHLDGESLSGGRSEKG
jgi:hypothetical protein